MNKYLSFFLCLVLLVSCVSDHRSSISAPVASTSEVRFAERFSIAHEGDVDLITIDRPWQGSNDTLRYLLYKDTIPVRYQYDNAYIKIKTPVKTVISNLTTQLALMQQLEVADRLVGFSQTQFIYADAIRERVSQGLIDEIGPDGSLDIEKILHINPDIVLAFSAGAENRQLQKLQDLGVKVVMNAGYLETSVLGRFEWIKLLGYLTGTEALATQIFDQKVRAYDSLTRLTEGIDRPTVMTGMLYGGTWYMPAGKNYGSDLIEAAGGQYLWQEDQNTGWLSLDFESVYARAMHADYWIGVASYTRLDDLKLADERYADFNAFKRSDVYSYTARVNENGANDYFESGNAQPDKILADHIKILHPEVLPDYELYYYRKLE